MSENKENVENKMDVVNEGGPMTGKRKADPEAPDGESPTKKTATTPTLPEAARTWFQNTIKVMNIVVEEKRQRGIVVLRYDTLIKDALATLRDNNILSAPVTATGGPLHTNEDDFFLGILDVDTVFRKVMTAPEITNAAEGKRWEKLSVVANRVCESKCMDLLRSARMRYYTAEPIVNAPVQNLILKGFFGGDKTSKHSCHRVACWENNRIATIITQSDVVKYINEHKDHLGEFASKSASQLGLVHGNVVSVPDTMLAADAFYKLFESGTSSVAVVDSAGKLVDNLSISDFRGLSASDITWLAEENVARFLQMHHANLKKAGRPRKHPVVSCHYQTQLKTLLDQFVSKRVHRQYVVTPQNEPIGIVTLTDVLRLFL